MIKSVSIISWAYLHQVIPQNCRNPVYTPSGLGYFCLIEHVVHDGTTLLLPLPKYPFCHRMYWRYAAKQYPWLLKSDLSAKTSILPTIATESASRSSTRLWNDGCNVTQNLCLQHLFSSAIGIGQHLPHMYQLGIPLMGGCCPGGGGCGISMIAQNSFKNFDSGCHGHGNPNIAVSTPPKRLRKELPNTPTRQFVSTAVVNNDHTVNVSRITYI